MAAIFNTAIGNKQGENQFGMEGWMNVSEDRNEDKENSAVT
jgi:hypothetical protein